MFSRLKSFTILITLLVTVSQGSVNAPVACFESDGHITVEADCAPNLCGQILPEENNHIETCENCLDIPIWLYTPEFKQALKASNQTLDLITFDSVAQHTINAEQNINCTVPRPNLVALKSQPQLAILYTRLLL